MFSTQLYEKGDVALLQCKGRIVHSDAAYQLRNAVAAQQWAHTVVLDLSRVEALEGGGLGMLAYLQRWSENHGMDLKLFNPSSPVRQRVEQARPFCDLEFLSAKDLESLMHEDQSRAQSNAETLCSFAA
ncbi:MAG: STAS domain-containing protein [Acidobacteriales bacterium]|nr:STAS domain-containing protein [Terriglobales bacterium]